MAKNTGFYQDSTKKPFQILSEQLKRQDGEILGVFQKNLLASCHDGRHRAADPRAGRTRRRHRFGKKMK